MPDGLDTVVMQEDVRIEEQSGTGLGHDSARSEARRQSAACRRGHQARRRAGRGRRALATAGRGERSRDAGLDRLRCYAPLKVAIVSTGDEIMRPGESFVPGKVYDANAPMLEGLIEAAGAEASRSRRLAGQSGARPRGAWPRRRAITT